MKQLVNFTKDESGAVTVDWVVLTAAIVGIAIAVITLISGGVESASEGVNGGLEVASNFGFGGSDYEFNGKTWGDYRNEADANYDSGEGSTSAYQLAANDAPDGYGYTGSDNQDGHAIYMSLDGETVMVAGVETSSAESEYGYMDPYYLPEA
mgnify:CR=1 FL=1